MKAFSVSWNPNTDETKITFSKDLKESSFILKLDILKDAIYELENEYNLMLNNMKKENNVVNNTYN
jgi:hypothetical protein